MPRSLSRRTWMQTATATALGTLAVGPTSTWAQDKPKEPFGYCLNASTIFNNISQVTGKKLTVIEQAKIAHEAGFQGFEPWIRDLDAQVKSGTTPADLNKLFSDLGLKIESSIGFAEWIVADEARRKKGLEEAKRNMELVQQIGGKRMAAPPVGATDQTLDLFAVADRYRQLAELGQKMGIIPEIEMWGFSKCLRKLGEVVFVAMESAHPQACVLPDIYHFYKGGTDFSGLELLRGKSIGIFHVNDYPAIDPAKIVDADRVFPGDGIAPVSKVLKTLWDIGYRGMLSLELFNKEYWKQDPAQVAKAGLAKMKEAVAKALA